MKVKLPCGRSIEWEDIPDYDDRQAMAGKFCPFTGAPLEESQLHRYDAVDQERYRPGIEMVKEQLEGKKKKKGDE